MCLCVCLIRVLSKIIRETKHKKKIKIWPSDFVHASNCCCGRCSSGGVALRSAKVDLYMKFSRNSSFRFQYNAISFISLFVRFFFKVYSLSFVDLRLARTFFLLLSFTIFGSYRMFYCRFPVQINNIFTSFPHCENAPIIQTQ